MPRVGRLVLLCACLAVSISAARSQDEDAPATVPEPFRTVAERSAYQATSRSAEVEALVDRLVDHADHVRRLDIGRTNEGRPIVAAVVADPPVDTPHDLHDDPRLVVLLLGNIHSGECAGKEALLMLLRDLSLTEHHRWLKHAVFLIVPNYNADGNDRMGPDHRPGQHGPDKGMGIRENAQGLDLNRDFIKLETPEGQALARFIAAWNPALFIDTHTTNGSKHRYVLTYDAPHSPATPEPIRRFLRDRLLPEVTRKLAEQGMDTFYYGNFDKDRKRWETYGSEGQYSTEYVGLRGRLAILSEAYSYASYRRRIEATKAFVTACIDHVVAHRDDVRTLLKKAADVSQTDMHRVALRTKAVALPNKVTVKGYDEAKEASDGEKTKKGEEPDHSSPSPQLPPKDYTLDFIGKFEATLSVRPPRAYVIPAELSRVADHVRLHGIAVERLTEEVSVEVEVDRATEWKRSTTSYQGHQAVTVEIERRKETRKLPRGTYIVRTDGPLGTLATYLLESRSESGLVRWNFFDHVWWEKGQDYPVLRVVSEKRLPSEKVDRIAPAERLTLRQLDGPKGRVPFSGSMNSARWIGETNSYRLSWAGRDYRVDAATGARTGLSREETVKMQAALARLSGFTEADAHRLASRFAPRLPDQPRVVFSHANDLFAYDARNGSARRLTHSPQREELAELSPNGEWVAFVRQHNLYVVGFDDGIERAVTTDGATDRLNGKLDWVYQEELYGRGHFKAFWWSPDSRYIAFLQLDERPVHRYTVADNIPVRQRLEVTPYPKAGDPLPRVKLGIVPAVGGTIRWADLESYRHIDLLISRVDWHPEKNILYCQLQDRQQTWLDLCRVDPRTGKRSRILRESTKAWVSALGPPHFLKDGGFLWESERSGARHLWRYDAKGKLVGPVTEGDWEIARFHGLDPQEEWVYFDAYKENRIGTDAYRVRLDGGAVERLTRGQGSHSVRFSHDKQFFIDVASGMHRPYSVTLYRTGGPRLRVISPYFDDRLKYYALKEPEFLHVETSDDAVLDAVLIRPPDFDPQRKYPVLIHVYSGPQIPTVQDAWRGTRYLWHQYLAQQGYVIWSCDNRSASCRGVRAAWPIYGNLGEHELADIEAGVSWLKKQPWVDSERIGIWGWSYGGYMTAYALTHSKSFRAGIAGAPVTDWKNYDAIYTERYMKLPEENREGYKKSSVIAAAKDLHGRLLLIHGTQDDNVHPANTLQFVLELQKAGKSFDLMFYPKNRHGVRQPDQSRHLRRLMTEFILRHL